MDFIDIARYFGALFLVLGLLGFAWVVTRKYGVPGVVQRQATRRLSIVESLMIGPRYKVLLLKCDSAEHLVLVGPQGASVIEAGISGIGVRPEQVSPIAARAH